MKKYENPEAEIITIKSNEIITESDGAFDLEEDVL